MGILGKSGKPESQFKPNVEPGAAQTKSEVRTDIEPKQVSQKDAVFTEVKKVIKDKNLTVVRGTPIGSVLSDSHKQEIATALMSGFKSKRYLLKDTESNKKKLEDDKLLKAYVLGLLKNWLERDKRLKNENGEFNS